MKIPQAAKDPALQAMFQRLYRHFGPRNWWPGDSPFEVIVGAVLTQNTSWKNVEKAIENLKKAKALSPKAIAKMSATRLANLIRPSGYFRLKAKRLQAVVKWFLNNYGGRIEKLSRTNLFEARESLVQVWGVGPETADSILCYAAGRNSFVVDLYTKRVLSRHGILPESSSYEVIKLFFEERLIPKNSIYNEFHAQIVAVGNQFCKPRPLCEKCPLKPMLPKYPHARAEKNPAGSRRKKDSPKRG